MKFIVLAVTGLLSSVSCTLTLNFAVNEKRDISNSNWKRSDVELDCRMVLPMSIGLTQRNLVKGHEYLMDISDPSRPDYAKHWTPEQVAETCSPSKETVDAVMLWLASNGISENRIEISKSLSWIRFNSTIGEAERLIKTKCNVYEHPNTKKPHVACDEYRLPIEIKEYIDFITPTISFDAT